MLSKKRCDFIPKKEYHVRVMQQFYEWFFLEKGRTGDALFSWPHLVSVTITLAIALALAILLGKRFKDNPKAQTITLTVAGAFIVFVQIIKIVYLCIGSDNIWDTIVGNAPLYLCDMEIFIIPLAALTRGRFRDCCLDFVAIWGLLMGFFGTYLAGNIYPAHAAISYAAFISLLNHAISGFAALFIMVTGMNKMEKRNIPFTIGILVLYMTVALIVDYVDEHNFMFFFHGDGTPFTLFDMYLSFGLKPIYQLWIYVLQCGYMVLFYYGWYGAFALYKRVKIKKEPVTE